ncbi:Aste57867_3710 [Aphanomyces stellatus]|uniref:Aste57867_3710 protein n=1 Tax=Aphanomyces stellatus TaxID=120398 RepID=A0A485KEN1_9STRA|nr:hypothetical protein As57867_003699 [Aphanomyces stellatus]VFT80864.1 Aste57867_3710 [Aphanomyces stellatus]
MQGFDFATIDQTTDASTDFESLLAAPLDTAMLSVSAVDKCGYRTGKCFNIRAYKRNGKRHKLCDFHREKANWNQMKLDRKKRQHRDGSSVDGSDDDDVLFPPPSIGAAIILDTVPPPTKKHRPCLESPTRIDDAPPMLAIDELDFFCDVMSPRQTKALLQLQRQQPHPEFTTAASSSSLCNVKFEVVV